MSKKSSEYKLGYQEGYKAAQKELAPKEVRLTQGAVAIVDARDYEKVAKYNWSANRAGRTMYARHHVKNRKYIWMHALIMGTVGIDHINGNGLDNRRANLRIATQQEQSYNKRKRQNTISLFKGVTYKKANKKWLAYIRKENKTHYLGIYALEIDAARAYDEAAKKLFGEFANLNLSNQLN